MISFRDHFCGKQRRTRKDNEDGDGPDGCQRQSLRESAGLYGPGYVVIDFIHRLGESLDGREAQLQRKMDKKTKQLAACARRTSMLDKNSRFAQLFCEQIEEHFRAGDEEVFAYALSCVNVAWARKRKAKQRKEAAESSYP